MKKIKSGAFALALSRTNPTPKSPPRFPYQVIARSENHATERGAGVGECGGTRCGGRRFP